MRILQVFLLVLCVGLVLVMACGKPTRHTEPPHYVATPMPDEAAELVALYLSGEVLAPLQLYERVHKELEQLRDEYPQEEAAKQISYFDEAIGASVIDCQVDSQTFTAITQGEFTAWDSLNALYHLQSFTPYHHPGMSYYLFLQFEGRRHPKRLAEAYRLLPGFLGTWMAGGAIGFGCIPSFFPRMSGNTITYLATNYPWGGDCGYYQFWYYASSGGGVGFFGFWERNDHGEPPHWWSEAEKNMDEMFEWMRSN